jgi:hypothetical protein
MTYPPTYSYPPPPKKTGRGTAFYLGLAGIIGGGLCLCLVLAAGAYYLFSISGGKPASPVAAQGKSPAAPTTTTKRLATSMPLPTMPISSSPIPDTPVPDTAIPEVVVQPSLTPTIAIDIQTTQNNPPAGNAREYFDDFSNPNSGWHAETTTDYRMDYYPNDTFVIDILKPKLFAYLFPPYQFPRPVKNVVIEVKVKPAQADLGSFGVMCNVQDKSNYYYIAISNGNFGIGKMVKGKWTDLTSPFWNKLIVATPDPDGYYTIGASCIDGFIVMQVNGIGQVHLVDTDIPDGDVAIFAASFDKADAGGIYAAAIFKSISVILQ